MTDAADAWGTGQTLEWLSDSPPAPGNFGTLALVSAVLAGYGMAGGKRRSWLHLVAYATINASAAYVILDLEYPRVGLIRIDSFDQVLVDLRQSMN